GAPAGVRSPASPRCSWWRPAIAHRRAAWCRRSVLGPSWLSLSATATQPIAGFVFGFDLGDQKHESHERLRPPGALRWWWLGVPLSGPWHPRARRGRAGKQEAASEHLDAWDVLDHRSGPYPPTPGLSSTTGRSADSSGTGAAGRATTRRLRSRRHTAIDGAESA